MARLNMHATAVILGDRGLLVAGPSGSGKSTLGLALLSHFQARGLFARLVGDDQVFLEARGGHLVCSVPTAISGLVEIRGVGPRPIGFEPRAVVDILVRLTMAEEPDRFPEDATEEIAGCPVPCLTLAGRNVAGAILAVSARLLLPPFAGTGAIAAAMRQNG